MQIRIRKIHIAAFAVILAFAASYAAHAQEHADGVHHGFHDAAHWAQVTGTVHQDLPLREASLQACRVRQKRRYSIAFSTRARARVTAAWRGDTLSRRIASSTARVLKRIRSSIAWKAVVCVPC